MSQRPQLLPEGYLTSPVPVDIVDALLRDLITLIPGVGDLYNIYELAALARSDVPDKELAMLFYLLDSPPGPGLPLDHVLLYLVARGGKVA